MLAICPYATQLKARAFTPLDDPGERDYANFLVIDDDHLVTLTTALKACEGEAFEARCEVWVRVPWYIEPQALLAAATTPGNELNRLLDHLRCLGSVLSDAKGREFIEVRDEFLSVQADAREYIEENRQRFQARRLHKKRTLRHPYLV